MPCIIADRIVTRDASGGAVPQVDLTVLAEPTLIPLFELIDGMRIVFDPKVSATSKPDGSWSLSFPWPSESDPNTVNFKITLPDGNALVGAVPEGVAGPLTLYDLKQSYGWGLAKTTILTPIAIQGPPGASVVLDDVGPGPDTDPRYGYVVGRTDQDKKGRITSVNYVPAGKVDVLSFAGDHLGSKIAAADAWLGQNAGILYIAKAPTHDFGPDTITLSDNHSLHLDDALYENTVSNGFLLKVGNYCHVLGVGSHWGARVVEPRLSGVAVVAISDSAPGGGAGCTGIRVAGLKFLKSPIGGMSQVLGCLNFGNVTDIVIEDNYLDGTSGFGITFGSNSNNGFHASGILVRGNVCDSVATQNINVVNGNNFRIVNNIIRGYSPNGVTYIDCEINEAIDADENFIISGNVIDASNGMISSPGTGIAVTATQTIGYGRNANRGIVSNNVILGGLNLAEGARLAVGIAIRGNASTLVSGNNITRCGQGGIIAKGSMSCCITGNVITNCGSTYYGSAVGLYSSQGCVVSGNSVTANSNQCIGLISEFSGVLFGLESDYNTIHGNTIQTTPRTPSAADFGLGYFNGIRLYGANSYEYDNKVNDLTLGVAGVSSIGSLRSGHPPYERNAANPATALLLGVADPCDSQPTMFYYDASATVADNGFSVVKPTLVTGSGRWLRAPTVPKMTTAARTSVTLSSIDAGIVVFDLDTASLWIWTGSAWKQINAA